MIALTTVTEMTVVKIDQSTQEEEEEDEFKDEVVGESEVRRIRGRGGGGPALYAFAIKVLGGLVMRLRQV